MGSVRTYKYRLHGDGELSFLDSLPGEYNFITAIYEEDRKRSYFDEKILIPTCEDKENGKPFEVTAIVVSPYGINIIILCPWKGKITNADDNNQWYLNGSPMKSPMNFCDACDHNVENLLYDKFHRSSGVTKTILYMPDVVDIDFQNAQTTSSKAELLEMLQEEEIRRFTDEECLDIIEFLMDISLDKSRLVNIKEAVEIYICSQKQAQQKQQQTPLNQQQTKNQQKEKTKKTNQKKTTKSKTNQKKKNTNKSTNNKANKNTAQAKNQAKSSPKTTTKANVQNNSSEKFYIGLKKPETNVSNGNYDVAQVKNQTKNNKSESEKKTASDFIVFLILLALLAGFIGYILWDFNKNCYGEGYVCQNSIIDKSQYPTM